MSFDKKAYDREYHRKTREYKILQRVCVLCPQPALPGHVYCKTCGIKRLLQQRKQNKSVPRSRANAGRSSVYLDD